MGNVQGIATLNQIQRDELYICRLGFRSGISCGYYIARRGEFVFQYRNISDHGDSGGPVWVQMGDGRRMAAGVHSFGQASDATQAGAAAILPVVNDLSRYQLMLWG